MLIGHREGGINKFLQGEKPSEVLDNFCKTCSQNLKTLAKHFQILNQFHHSHLWPKIPINSVTALV